MSDLPQVSSWVDAVAADTVLPNWAGAWSGCFGVQGVWLSFVGGRFAGTAGGEPDFVLQAPEEAWAKFFTSVPPRHYHNFFAMLARVRGTAVSGSLLKFYQHAHVVRRVLEIGRFAATGAVRPSVGAAVAPVARGGYVGLPGGVVYYETAGTGRDVLCLHTAGSDGRQFHRLMADSRVTGGHRLVAFDLPWHGRSPGVAGAAAGSWRLTTELYVRLIMDFVAAAGLRRPVVLGASMSGEICLELALRHPEAFSAIIACEACDRVEGRFTSWPSHPAINQGWFIPEWIYGLMAPQSPAECADEVAWHYAQSGPAVFTGDIGFYAGEWNARDRVERIDTSRCPLFMLTGEYDYSCTVEMSEATAAKIPGVTFLAMPGMGHFPFAENPALFAQYLLPILETLKE